MFRLHISLCFGLIVILSGCSRMDHFGKAPSFTPTDEGPERRAMYDPGLPLVAEPDRAVDRASLWSGGQRSLLGDRRAIKRGDILTVVIEIDDEAQISNSTSRSRNGSENMGIPHLLGIPQRINERLP